jgi:hypothetical protein
MRQWGRKAWWNSLSSGEVMVDARTIGEFEEATEKLRDAEVMPVRRYMKNQREFAKKRKCNSLG